MIDDEQPPDLVLDLTHSGLISEVIKSLSLDLGLPTVTTTMGEDIKYLILNSCFFLIYLFWISEWSKLTEEQAKYLIQVRSPADTFQTIVHDLALETNITDAAIFYDESFSN